MRHIFIIIPSAHPTGPIKGAYALANALAAERTVTLVTLKTGPGADAPLENSVSVRSLADAATSWHSRVTGYRELLRRAGGRQQVASISMCLSADIVNCFSGENAVTCASVRGNLVRNYRLDYGLPGVPVAVGHLAALRKADHIVAITAAMAAQIRFYARRNATVIGNFVDEASLDAYRSDRPRTGPFRFVYVATLSERKQPLLAIRAVRELRRVGVDVMLDVIGDGPLAAAVAAEIARLDLTHHVIAHGHIANPYGLVADADAMVLPSLSEGMARSALEALHLGVPCVMRNVDGNAELIPHPRHGALFDSNERLAETMLSVASASRGVAGGRESLLPAGFRQREQARRYLEIVEERR